MGILCPSGQRCYVEDGRQKCGCPKTCKDMLNKTICGETNLKWYKNECELRREECKLKTKIGISILPCKG